MLDTVRTLSTQPLMNGRRVAVVSNSKSPTVLATGSLVRAGLEVVTPPQPSRGAARLPTIARRWRRRSPIRDIHAVMVIHAPPLQHAIGEPTEAIDGGVPRLAEAGGRGACWAPATGRCVPGSPIPSFRFPEQPAAVLGRIADYSDWRRAEERERAELEAVRDDIDVAAARRASSPSRSTPATCRRRSSPRCSPATA